LLTDSGRALHAFGQLIPPLGPAPPGAGGIHTGKDAPLRGDPVAGGQSPSLPRTPSSGAARRLPRKHPTSGAGQGDLRSDVLPGRWRRRGPPGAGVPQGKPALDTAASLRHSRACSISGVCVHLERGSRLEFARTEDEKPPYPSDRREDQWSLLLPLVPPPGTLELSGRARTDMPRWSMPSSTPHRGGWPWRNGCLGHFPPWRTVLQLLRGPGSRLSVFR